MQTEIDFEIKNDRFWTYHREYPQVYGIFKELIFEAMKKGHKHFSARGLFQVYRFKRGGDIKKDGYKLNNNYTPYYVRLFEKEHPEHKGFFEKRKTSKTI